MQVSVSTVSAKTFLARRISRFIVLTFLVALQMQLVSSVSAEVTFLNTWGSYGSGDGEFVDPWGIALSDTGQVYVTDLNNDRIQRFFDSDAWSSGTNIFIDSGVGPTSVAVGPGDMLGTALTLDATKGLVVGDTTTVNTGGSLTVDGGLMNTSILFLDSVALLSAAGEVVGNIAGARFSNIVATGTLSIGESNSHGGFDHQGSLAAGTWTIEATDLYTGRTATRQFMVQ